MGERDKSIVRKVIFLLTKQEKRHFIYLLFGSLLLSLSETFGIGIIIPIMHLYINPSKINSSIKLQWLYRAFSWQDTETFLVALIITAIVLFVLKSLFAMYMVYRQRRFIGGIYNRLTDNILRSYLDKPYEFHLENNSSALFKNVIAEVGQVTQSFLIPVIVIITEILVGVGIFLLLVWVYPAIMFALLALFGVCIVIMNFVLKKKIAVYSSIRLTYSEQMYRIGLETLQAVKEIKIYSSNDFFINKFRQAANKYTEALVNFEIISSLPKYIIEAFLFASVLGLLLLSIYQNWSVVQVIPMLTIMGIALARLLPSVNKIYSNYNLLRYGLPSLDIICNVLEGKDEKKT